MLKRTFNRIGATLLKVWNFYLEGFRNMKLGRILWMIIIIKLCVMFLILRPFFFPRFLSDKTDKKEYVSNELIERSTIEDEVSYSKIKQYL